MTPLRRCVAVLVPALLLATLAACGGEAKPGYGDETTTGFDGVEVSGDFGKKPKLEWKTETAYPDKTETNTLIEGDGKEIGSDDSVNATLYIGNATTMAEDWVFESPEPVAIAASAGPAFEAILADARIGDRVEAMAPSEDIFTDGAGNPAIGIGNHDAVLIVADLESIAPSDEVQDVDPSAMPSVVDGKDGKPASLDFSGVKKPKVDGRLQRAVLEEGDGPELTGSETVTVNYLGQVYGGKEPFDSNQTAKGFDAQLGGGVVQGWTTGLTGVKVGSRVMLAIPPRLGYGDQGQGDIKGTDTMYFVIDVKKVAKG